MFFNENVTQNLKTSIHRETNYTFNINRNIPKFSKKESAIKSPLLSYNYIIYFRLFKSPKKSFMPKTTLSGESNQTIKLELKPTLQDSISNTLKTKLINAIPMYNIN